MHDAVDDDVRAAFAALRVERDRLRVDVAVLRSDVAMLRAELASQYPIAVAAREAAEISEGDEDVAITRLRCAIRDIDNSTEAAKLEYLPTRLRGTP